jgi:hypothetical protein
MSSESSGATFMPDPSNTAAQLLAFHAEPVRHRQRLTSGREPFPGGAHVFRFAQGKFPPAILKKFSEPERAHLREAAIFFVRQACFWEGATHYQVLCVAPDARPQAIRENYQALMALIHPDRKGEGEEAWPESFAQRANQAWAVLSDPASRKSFDDSAPRAAAHAHAMPPVEPPMRRGGRKGHATGVRIRTTVKVASLGLAGMFFAYAWWASQLPSEYATLQGATPFQQSLQWMRDVGSTSRLPGFMGFTAVRAPSEPEANLVEPVAQRVSLALPASAPANPVPADPVPARPDEMQAPAAQVPMTRESSAANANAVSTRARTDVLAQRAPAEPQVKSPPSPKAPAVAPDLVQRLPDLEVLVTRIVAYYEQGDLERLLGLYYADSLGIVEAYRIRNDFAEFFRSTTARKLRIRQVDWASSEAGPRGRGEATVLAEYQDSRPRLEKALNLEIDVVVIEGRPRISRMSLFPHQAP